MVFNVKSYMQDIDREVMQHRQEIAKHQVRIQQLEDMRVLMQQREEIRAEVNGEPSPFGMLPGVEIAVRERRLMLMDDGVLSHAAAAKSAALPSPGLNKSGDRRGMAKGKRTRKLGKPPVYGENAIDAMRAKVLATLKTEGKPMDTSDIRQALGLEGTSKMQPVKSLHNAIYSLRKHGLIERDDNNYTYHLPGQY
jgi:hypothetical protein